MLGRRQALLQVRLIVWLPSPGCCRLSHSSLAAGCLEVSGVTGHQRQEVVGALQGLQLGSRGLVGAKLAALGLPEQAVQGLAPLLEAEGPLSQVWKKIEINSSN